MRQYLDLVSNILENGLVKKDRTGIGTKSIFGTQLRFNLDDGFPAVTSKKLAWKSVVSELLWFLEGSTNEHRLAEIKNDNKPYETLSEKERFTIWTENANKQGVELGYSDGELGNIYGKQYIRWAAPDREINQVKEIIKSIKTDAFSRRHIVNAWNVGELDTMSLPPCHMMYQLYVIPDKDNNPHELSLMWYQRSVDVALGLPFNIASYALLLNIIAKLTNLKPKELIFIGGDTHIYLNHIEPIKKQLLNTPFKLPTLKMPEFNTLEDVIKCKTSDFKLINYKHHDFIKMKMAV